MRTTFFISWSRPQAKAAALALRDWLPRVIQASRPWMSETDMGKGKPWLDELMGALGGLKLGMVCLTRECLSEPWVLFEAGVIYKGLDRDARTWTKEALVTLLRKTNRFSGQSSSPITVREVPQRL